MKEQKPDTETKPNQFQERETWIRRERDAAYMRKVREAISKTIHLIRNHVVG
jgi:hypothetical protein